jgi:uncharacterized membrane protein YfcA
MQYILPEGYAGHPAVYMITALVAFSLTGISKGGFGGVAVLAIPLMMLVAPGKLALGIWLPLLIFCDIWTIRLYLKEWSLRPIAVLAPWMCIGLAIGYVLLGRVDDRLMKLFVGFLSIGFVLLEIARIRILRYLASHQEREPWRPNWMTAAPFGIVGGVCSMLAHAAGAITTIYLLSQRMDRRSFVGTSARFYIVFNVLRVPLYASPSIGVVTAEAMIKSLWLMPFVPLTVWLGSALNRRMSPTSFNKVIYILLALSGAYLLYANWSAHPPAS